MRSKIFPLTLPADLLDELRRAASATDLSMADVLRQSTKLGLPKLLAQLGAQRITNISPLPDKVARRLYAQSDDDADGIALFMAAQAKNLEE